MKCRQSLKLLLGKKGPIARHFREDLRFGVRPGTLYFSEGTQRVRNFASSLDKIGDPRFADPSPCFIAFVGKEVRAWM